MGFEIAFRTTWNYQGYWYSGKDSGEEQKRFDAVADEIDALYNQIEAKKEELKELAKELVSDDRVIETPNFSCEAFADRCSVEYEDGSSEDFEITDEWIEKQSEIEEEDEEEDDGEDPYEKRWFIDKTQQWTGLLSLKVDAEKFDFDKLTYSYAKEAFLYGGEVIADQPYGADLDEIQYCLYAMSDRGRARLLCDLTDEEDEE